MEELPIGAKRGESYTDALRRIEAKLDHLLERKKPKPRAAKSDYCPQFEVAWDNYPKRIGNNPKKKAYEAYKKRHDEGVTYDELNFAATAYCLFCDATIDDKQYVMMASTFYGHSRPYEQDWSIPDSARKSAIPRDDNEMVAWAKQQGLREPRPGETYNTYRAYVTSETI